MARELNVDCPSGLSLTVREFRVSDEDLLATPASVRKGLSVTSLLQAIVVRVDESGPYTLTGSGDERSLDWANVLQGDRMTVLLKNRIFTWGNDLVFRQPCPNCTLPVETEIDLNEMPIKPLPEESMPHVLDPKQPLYVTLPGCGKRIGFRLLRGRDEKALQKIQKQQKATQSSSYLRYRVVEIEGVEQPNWKKWLSELGGRDASFLRASFDEADCGVDQEVEFECDQCSHIWRDDVRFRADFLFPKYRGRTTNKGS